MTAPDKEDYARLVDEALSAGKQYASDNLRAYDIRYFAEVMWRIEPMVEWSRELDETDQEDAETALVELYLAVQIGHKHSAQSNLERLIAIARKNDRDLPVPKHVPLPIWAAD